MIANFLLCSFVFKILTAQGVAVNAPPDGKVLLGAWLDTTDPPNQRGAGDRPLKFSQRTGLNISTFQFAQDLPNIYNSDYMANQIDALRTDAILYITVFPKPSPWAISDDAIAELALQCQQLNAKGRQVLIRFAPEFNGEWMEYGGAPVKFKTLWRRVYTAIKRVAKLTDLIWSPNAGNGYPWGINRGFEDFSVLDTNGNGVMDGDDDPYEPYYPGDEYVDWVGTSNYHFGSSFPYYDNSIPVPFEFENNLNTAGLYNTYAVKRNKPFSISETGSAYHPEVSSGPSELDIKRVWWRQTITDADLLNRYPQLKMFCLFEFQKYEGANGADLRDFRISSKPEILSAFIRDFENVKDRYVFGNYTAPPAGWFVTPDGLFMEPTETSTTQTTPLATQIKIFTSSTVASFSILLQSLLFVAVAFSQF